MTIRFYFITLIIILYTNLKKHITRKRKTKALRIKLERFIINTENAQRSRLKHSNDPPSPIEHAVKENFISNASD